MNTPFVSGFTFIKNGLTLGYPIKESIESIEPLCDEIIINVGFDDPSLLKDDGTFEYLKDNLTHPKFKFLKSFWNPELTSQGLILSEQTNISLNSCKGEICQYIQGDEVIHEDDLQIIHNAYLDMESNKQIDGLVFKYNHFYGDVDIVKKTRNIYRREVRTIRGQRGIKSWLDAQGFRNKDNNKINCIQTDARIFHYGWARSEKIMKKKVKAMDKLYHGKDFEGGNFQYERIWGLKKFKETHPRCLKEWLEKNKNPIEIMDLPLKNEWKNVGLAISDLVESLTGYRIGEYKNFKLI